VIEGAALIIAVIVSHRIEVREPVEPVDAVPETAPRAEPTAPLEWRFGAGASASLLEGIAPGPLPGAGGFLEFSTMRQGLSPSVRVGLHHSFATPFTTHGTRATFGLTSGVVTACPLAWLPANDWAVRPCVAGSYGSLVASGSGTAAPTERHPWASVGGALALEFGPLPELSFELRTAVEAAVVSSRFMTGDAVLHETAPVSGRLSLGIIGHLP
jgi:hypothetical protein